jgi:O-antigen ligase
MKQSKRVLLALAAALVLTLGLAPALSARLGAIINASTYTQGPTHAGNSLAWRLDYWAQIVHLADRNPATGIGYGMTSAVTQQGAAAHNDYLRAYVETGLVGLAVYLVVIVVLIRLGLRAVRAARPGTFDYSIAVGYLGCALALALASVSSNVITGVAKLWYFVAFAAAASSVLRRSRTPSPQHEDGATVTHAPSENLSSHSRNETGVAAEAR